MKRDARVDFIKTLGIIFVVMGHSGSPLAGYLYTFHMPLFFFVTGYLRCVSKDYSWWEFINKKIKKIIIPYVTFWTVSIIYSQLSQFYYNGTVERLEFRHLQGLFLGGQWLADNSINFPLWYLQLLFIATIVFEFICRYCNNYFKVFISYKRNNMHWIKFYNFMKQIFYINNFVILRILQSINCKKAR